MFKKLWPLFMAAAFILLSTTPALAADGKMISSAICQAMSPAGAEHLMHRGSSLQAVGSDVTVICPIVKDSIGGKLLWVDIRHLRPNGAGGQTVTGRVYSCNSTHGGCWQSGLGTSSSSNQYTSVFLSTDNLPHSSDHYFYYRTVLPEGWKIIAVEYKEQ